ncbi:MAG: hypothetical protein LUG51_08770 [Tannerellaceae bacterium]|nr:hypothetical protein [Tannerellaceae bacterium]
MNKKEKIITQRYKKIRHQVQKECDKLINYLRSPQKHKERIVGIDAASAEIYNRPEIFGVSYRKLRKMQRLLYHEYGHLTNSSYNPFKFTFHVGEDFMDIADGLRAIDESILFLQLQKGDRISHALALGVDAEEYYRRRNNILVMRKQDLLDNFVWIYIHINNKICCCTKVINRNAIKAINELLKVNIKKYGEEIFNYDLSDEKQIFTYYQSMLLRSDDPGLYTNENILNAGNDPEKHLNHPEVNNARTNPEACQYYKDYIYETDMIKKGYEPEEFKVNGNYIKIIKLLQTQITDQIQNTGISIEANPTSNFKIGYSKDYSDLPCLKTYKRKTSYGTTSGIPTSINTDDQGIFNTSIENEYRLVATALSIKKKNTYKLLEEMRQEGFDQKFR